MTLPGLDTLTHLAPGFASQADRLGTAVWHATDCTPRETTSALLGCDLALGLLDLPFTLHVTMARTLKVSDAYLTDILVHLAPALGYPTVAKDMVSKILHRPTIASRGLAPMPRGNRDKPLVIRLGRAFQCIDRLHLRHRT